MRPIPIPPQPGQESVWDYPRPARAEATTKALRVVCQGIVLAATQRGQRVLETSHPPTYYFPPEDVQQAYLLPNGRRGWCEWKGGYEYYDVQIGEVQIPNAAWRMVQVTPGFEALQGYFSFFAGLMDACFVEDERVIPQAGNFYGGWITSDIVGPFKGEPGTWGW